MKKIKVKFKCFKGVGSALEGKEIILANIIDSDSDENTIGLPSGSLFINQIHPKASKYFEPNKVYIAEFIEAEKED